MIKENFKSIALNAAKKQIGELKKINRVFNNSFLKAIELIHNCSNKGGRILCSGVGKSAIVAERTSKLLSSIGVPSFTINALNFKNNIDCIPNRTNRVTRDNKVQKIKIAKH